MNYTLNTITQQTSMRAAFKKLLPLLRGEKKSLWLAFSAMLINSAATFVGPFLIGHIIDHYIVLGNFKGVVLWSLVLIGIFVVAFISNYWQMMWMGMVGQRTLYNLRNMIFEKLQSLPIEFFNANKAGDLISRINSDTDKLNQFFSEIVVRFVGIIVTVVGVAAFLIGINPKLGIIALVPAIIVGIVIILVSTWIKKKSSASLKAMGTLSAEVQESLDNFKVVIAFDRRDFFRSMFKKVNDANYTAARKAGFSTSILMPLYEFAGGSAQLVVLVVGIAMILAGNFTVGLLVGFLVYVERFYSPLKQVSALWSQLQTALAAWDRISVILELQSNLSLPQGQVLLEKGREEEKVLSFNHVTFRYLPERNVLHDITFELMRGKTYALVGPTGGGKTTTASLMARLYDPTEGQVMLFGSPMRDYSDSLRSELIGFILQDPFLFSGTVQDNIFYGNKHYSDLKEQEALSVIRQAGLDTLLERFEGGLGTEVIPHGVTLSLGQKQIIAFMRAVLRKPKLLILDEATANIDTMTESVLEDILTKLPADTTKVIIAHRLNTIKNADEIFFVNGGRVTPAGSLDHAVEMLTHGKRTS